jgi:PAS domain-containing protein
VLALFFAAAAIVSAVFGTAGHPWAVDAPRGPRLRSSPCSATIDGCFVEVNPAWLETLGYRSEELVGRHLIDFVHREHTRGL